MATCDVSAHLMSMSPRFRERPETSGREVGASVLLLPVADAYNKGELIKSGRSDAAFSPAESRGASEVNSSR